MNQAFLFNDDLTFITDQRAWCITGMLSGQLLTFYVKQNALHMFNPEADEATIQFDIEALIEEWLDDNEPESDAITIG